MKKITFTLLTCLTILTGCFGFDTNTDDNIIGNYYAVAIDDSEESLSYNTNIGGGGFSRILVGSAVYEVQWNDNFILTKQHPEEKIESLIYSKIRFKIWRDITHPMKLKDHTELYFDTLLNNKVDSIAKGEFQRRMSNGELSFIKTTKREDLSLYYLIDIQNAPQLPILFFSIDSLNYCLDKLKVGKLTNKRTY
mgnify:CR=1 FL=1